MEDKQYKVLCLWMAKLITAFISSEYHRLGVYPTEEYLEALDDIVNSVDADVSTIMGVTEKEAVKQ